MFPKKNRDLIAFIHVPKAAGSTISMILRQSFLSQHCDVRCGNAFRSQPCLTAKTLSKIGWFYWRLKSIQGHGVVPYSDLCKIHSKMRFYTFLREPISRCASEYQYRVLRGGLTTPFEQWIQSPIARNRMTKMIAGVEKFERAQFILDHQIGHVGLVERFDESLLLFQHWVGNTRLDIRYQSKNVIGDNSIKNHLMYDSKTLALLRHANAEDVKLYHHARDRVYPKQVKDYGPNLQANVAAFQASNRRPLRYPRQLASLLKREFIYKPIALRLSGAR